MADVWLVLTPTDPLPIELRWKIIKVYTNYNLTYFEMIIHLFGKIVK